jgi:hypothetical protein
MGCGSLAGQLPQRIDTHINASRGKTWDAVVDYFARSGISVDTMDRSSGVITAEATAMPREKSRLVACGNTVFAPFWSGEYGGWELIGHYEAPPFGAPFTAIVHGDSTQATVHVTAYWIDAHGKQIKCTSSAYAWEQRSEAEIKAIAERR